MTGLEAIRGVAATLVILFHAAQHMKNAFGDMAYMRLLGFGHAGVDLFFVLSGFIILFVHKSDIGQPARVRRYAWRRCVRVLPTYWVVMALTLLVTALGKHAMPEADLVLWSATLLPSWAAPIPAHAWTMQYEMVFYAVFAVLILHRRIGLCVLAAWMMWIAADLLGVKVGAPPALGDMYSLGFFLGMGGAWLVNWERLPAAQIMVSAGAASFLAVGAVENLGWLDGYGALARCAYDLAAVLLIVGIVRAERLGWIAVPKALQALGKASYSIYLFQFLFMGVAWQVWMALGFDHTLPRWMTFASLVGAALVGGVVASRLVEMPMVRALRPGWMRIFQPAG